MGQEGPEGMNSREQVAVLGMGRFGTALAYELSRLGYEVLAVDRDEDVVNDVADAVTHAAQADITDPNALRDLGLADFDTAIVAVAETLEASILATVLLKQLGVRRIIAKAGTEVHGTILLQVGATRVVFPERETGLRLAHSFAAPGVDDYLDIAPGYGIARISVPSEWVGQSLGEFDLARTSGVTVVALRRGQSVTLNPGRAEALAAGDQLIVAGLDEDLARVPAPLGSPRRS
jgi:trk system potassium uptake protein TrkA